ncbi:CD209 antigen-like protein C [Dreissena polymorpha]|uniref:CD209 antigen-like protein C n=1 Tax=Dreissena polymorpha TaxID=45954 RepID=UPI002263F1FB|nr:CD209 antigen-like protein C [Dreissena polymorpha]
MLPESWMKCRPFEKVPNGTILGNLHFDGTKRLLKCDNGYVPKDSTNVISVCKNRQWTNITQCVQEECVLNQETFEGSTYTFAIKSRRNYNDSVAFCQHCGYRVVTIESDDEHNYLKEKMRGFFPIPASYHQTGEFDGFFLDFYNNGGQAFRMDNGSEVQYKKWGKGEPNSGEEMFIAVWGGGEWEWADVYPYKKFQTVCENET